MKCERCGKEIVKYEEHACSKRRVSLGQRVRDEITGFTGIVTGRFEYLYGCVRCSVSPQEMKDGKPIESFTFDEGQLIAVEEAPAVKPVEEKTGGPRDDAQTRRW